MEYNHLNLFGIYTDSEYMDGQEHVFYPEPYNIAGQSSLGGYPCNSYSEPVQQHYGSYTYNSFQQDGNESTVLFNQDSTPPPGLELVRTTEYPSPIYYPSGPQSMSSQSYFSPISQQSYDSNNSYLDTSPGSSTEAVKSESKKESKG